MKNFFNAIFKRNNIHKDASVRISNTVQIKNPNNIFIGTGSYVNGNSYLMAGKNSKIIIGKNCLISYNVHIRTETHLYMDRNKLIQQQRTHRK